MPYAGEIFYRELGRKHKGKHPPILFIHGAGSNGSLWLRVARNISTVHHLFVIDLPGHGKSSGDGKNSISDYAKEVKDFARKLSIRKFIVAGHSMGGAIAMTLALEHPDLISALILAGTGAKLKVHPSFINTLKEDFEGSVNFLTTTVSDPFKTEVIEQIKKAYLSLKKEVVLGDFLACDSFDLMDSINKINVPALILCGNKDILTPPKYSYYLKDKIKTSNLVIVHNAGHMLMLESTTRVSKEIKKFVNKIKI